MQAFVDRNGVDIVDHIPDGDGVIWERFGITEHRAYVLINDDGTWEETGYGSLEEDVLGLIES